MRVDSGEESAVMIEVGVEVKVLARQVVLGSCTSVSRHCASSDKVLDQKVWETVML